MASRDSFQKRQKEAARREKRQLKLDRRQGRQHGPSDSLGERSESDSGGNPAISNEETVETTAENGEIKSSAGLPADNRSPEL
ncbi:MAG: hypothetical protein JOY62_05415 [Acidobacteriaceae bacterium]|nr:hypothetical protein [Acidobacteriaceae bacterium]MBV9779395.1 hypothetical protein [Acidobacteriaceae bacterium]